MPLRNLVAYPHRHHWLRSLALAFAIVAGQLWLAGVVTGKDVAAQQSGQIDERGFGFILNIPANWSADINAEDGPIFTWRFQNNSWAGDAVPQELLSLSISVLDPNAGQDTRQEFTNFASKYASKFLLQGKVARLTEFKFGAHGGFDAYVEGGLRQSSGSAIEVSARIFIYLVDGKEVIVSAVAPREASGLLSQLGQTGTFIEAANASQDGEDNEEEAVAGIPQVDQQSPTEQRAVSILPGLRERFHSIAWGGGTLEEFGVLTDTGLTISIPAGARTAGVGIASTGTLLNLGDLKAGAVTEITAVFDPAQTDSALLVLCPGLMIPCLSDPSLQIFFQPIEGQTILTLQSVSGVLGRSVLRQGPPETLKIWLDKDAVYAFPSNGEAVVIDRPTSLVPFEGLELVAAAVPLATDSRLSLRKLDIKGPAANIAQTSRPPPDTAATLFPAQDRSLWRTLEANGGNFSSFATWQDDRLDVAVLPGNSWGTTGLVTASAKFKMPEASVDEVPGRVSGTVNPERSKSFAVSILPDPNADSYFSSLAYASFLRREDGTATARIHACGSATAQAEMNLSPAWSGAFEIVVHSDKVELSAGRQRVATRLTCSLPGLQGHIAIFATAPREHDPASLSLVSLASDKLRGNAATDGSDSEDADFNPANWIAAAAAEIDDATHQEGGQ